MEPEPYPRRFPGHLLVVLLAGFFAPGCLGVRYVFQAAGGQCGLTQQARPLADVIQDAQTSPRLRGLLGEVGAIKQFGEASGLKPTANYTEYVALDRPAVVWVVSACEPLRFKSRVWSFPIVGAFPYLGWFELAEANTFAQELRQEGLDVNVRGASAYSTLGWFRDALLSSMIASGDEALGYLVNVVLHESVHATLHLPSQAYFNESLASFVADRLTLSYLEQTRGPGSTETTSYERAKEASALRARRLHQAYEQLDRLYASAAPDAEKLQEKAHLLAELQAELGLRREVNNATLIQHRTYGVGEAEFNALYSACGSSWARFFGALRTLQQSAFSRPHQEDLAPVILPLAQQGCPQSRS